MFQVSQVSRQVDTLREKLTQQATLIEDLMRDTQHQDRENNELRMRIAALEGRHDVTETRLSKMQCLYTHHNLSCKHV